MISALLLGTTLAVDKGKDTGVFKSIPLCRSASQTGCVIAYATFRDTVPPPANSRFGGCRTHGGDGGGLREPGEPLRRQGRAEGLSLRTASNIASSAAAAPVWVKGKANPTTPFVATPGLLTGQCVSKNGFNYLEAHVNAEPGRPARRRHQRRRRQRRQGGLADWGLHLIDANIAMGNLVDVVGQESKAYLAKK
jgi:hypothetical protein